jgi:hypothetical protein
MTATATSGYDVLASPRAPRVPPPRQRRVRDEAYRWVSVEIGRRVAAHVENGLSIDQIVEMAKVLEVEPHTLMPDHMDNLRSEVAASVTAAMVEHGQTPEQLAEAIGMSAPALWRRLQGLAAFTAEDVVRIARALDVEVGVLLG